MPANYPTLRRRRLATELKRLRTEAGLSGEEAAAALMEKGGRWSHTKISRIETGQVGVHHGDVADLLDLYEVSSDSNLRAELIALARESGKKGWWHQQYGDVLRAPYSPYLDFEASAKSIRAVQGALVPGLLQTADYARAVIASVRVDATSEQIERFVDLRMKRRDVLAGDSPLQLWAILDEAVLHRLVGGVEVMRSQLRHLVTAQETVNVVLQVIPYAAGEHPGMDAPFTLIEFDDEAAPDVVYQEHLGNALYLEEPDEVRQYTLLYNHLQAAALSPKDSIKMIDAVAKEL